VVGRAGGDGDGAGGAPKAPTGETGVFIYRLVAKATALLGKIVCDG
jgi:hypothetical protein